MMINHILMVVKAQNLGLFLCVGTWDPIDPYFQAILSQRMT